MVVAISFVLLALFWKLYGNDLLERHFFYRPDQALWQKSKPKERYYIARYFIDHHSLIGLTRSQILAMLGTPYQDQGFALHYDLGPERGFISMDGILLDIFFENDKVSEVRLHVT